VCSSRPVEGEPGVYEVTTPGSYEVGHRLYDTSVAGCRPGYGLSWPDWLMRLVAPPTSKRNAHNIGLDTAEAELALLVRLGLVHESLVEEPGSLVPAQNGDGPSRPQLEPVSVVQNAS
jgi:hypothetical protein